MNLFKPLFVYLLTLFVKLVAFYYSNLTVILADAFHGIVDVSLILTLMIASHVSKKIADERHPHGHGMVKNVASLAVSVAFITLLSFELIEEGVNRILNPGVYENIEIALLAECIVFTLLVSATIFLRDQKGILGKTAMYETLNDSLSTLAAIFGILFVSFGFAVFDGVMTIAIALLIAYNSLRLFLENAKFLLGLSPSEEFYSRIEESVKAVKGVHSVHDMLAFYVAEGEVHIDLHITIDGTMKIEEADRLHAKIADKLRSEFPEIKHVSIHFCPHIGEKRKIYDSQPTARF